tara:strand:- start:28129 stop:28485 length:357 start_codon:yes stop_codon:yes gene_type:complete
MELQGKIKVVGETQTFGSNGFQKREVVVTTEEQYPQDIMVEFVQDKCELLNSYEVGQNVKIGINLRGRKWTNQQGEVKYFNSIQGWRIEKAEAQEPSAPPAFEPANAVSNDDTDGLPF